MSEIKIALGLFACLVLAAGCSQSPEQELAGVWTGTDLFGQTMEITLEEDGQLQLHVSKEDQSFTKQGTFSVDLSQNPAHFNIKLDDRDEIQTIMERIDEQTIAFENTNSGKRPEEFGEEKVVLERQ